MKTPKVFTVFFVIILFTNVLYAGNSSQGNTDDKANKMVERLSKDIALTDSQIVIIRAKAKAYRIKFEESNKITNQKDFVLKKIKTSKEYRMALDSILTNNQREQLTIKQEERREAILSKYQNKN